MKEILDRTAGAVTHIIRDEHDESGDHYFHTTYFDDAGLLANERIRSAALMRQGKKLPIVNERLDYVISFPTTEQYVAYMTKHPDVIKDLQSEMEHIRLKAARTIAKEHPSWLVSV